MRSLTKKNSYLYIFISIVLVLAMVFVAGASFFDIDIYEPIYYPTAGLTASVEDGVVKSLVGDFKGRTIEDSAGAMDLFGSLKGDFGIKNVEKELHFDKLMKAPKGFSFKLSQMYNNIPVFGRALNVSTDNDGVVLSITGNYMRNVKPRNKKTLTESAALVKANSMDSGKALSAELIVYSLEVVSPVYAYMVECDYMNTTLFLNAESGELIQKISKNTDVALGGKNYPSTQVDKTLTNLKDQAVNLKIEHATDGKYYLADATRNIVIRDATGIVDLKKLNSAPWVYSDNGTFTDKTAVSALENIIKSFDYYKDATNIGIARSGIDSKVDNIHDNQLANSEMAVTIYIHFGGANYENAAYVGGAEINGKEASFIFGDGNPATMSKFAGSIEVVGHEYQHAITANITSSATAQDGLVYMNASGAINESLSDIFGSLIADQDIASDNFWLIGEDCINPNQGKALRDMKDPESLQNPAINGGKYFQPFCYLPHDHSNCDNGGVHTNSSVINHAAYEMYRLRPDLFTKDLIGELWYSTLFLLSPDLSFLDLRNCLLQACVNNKYDKAIQDTVATAFDNVGIYATATQTQVKFDKGSMTGTAPSAIDCDSAVVGKNTFVIPACDLTETGFELVGWSTSGNDQSEIYRVGITYPAPVSAITLKPVRAITKWNDVALTTLQGEGSKASPYMISTAQEFATLAYYINNRLLLENIPIKTTNIYCQMTADIDLISKPWIPIGISGYYDQKTDTNLTINFDGAGHSVSHYVATAYTAQYGGLFGRIDGKISNLGINGAQSNVNTQFYGAIAGMIDGDITNCYNTSSIVNRKASNYTGGLVGCIEEYSSVSDSYNLGNVEGDMVGGIVATNMINKLNSKYTNYDSDRSNRDSRMLSYPTIGNVYNGGTLKGGTVGGIVGAMDGVVLSNAINIGRISASSMGGGIVGAVNTEDMEAMMINVGAKRLVVMSQILGCKNTGVISQTNGATIGAIVGKMFGIMTSGCVKYYNNSYKRESCAIDIGNYSSFGKVQFDMFDGDRATISGDVLYADRGAFDFDNPSYYADRTNWSITSWSGLFAPQKWTFNNSRMPMLQVMDNWSDHKATSYASGEGSAIAPYEIATAEQLALLAYNVNNSIESNKYYRLTANIDLGGRVWTPIGSSSIDNGKYVSNFFSGQFDGDNHKITNLYAVSNDDYDTVGLFGSVGYNTAQEGVNTIKNVALDNVNISGYVAGGIVAHVGGSLRMSGCDVFGGNISGLLVAGGVIGEMNYTSDRQGVATIERCSNNAIVATSGYGGGIIGNIDTATNVSIKNSVNKNEIIALRNDGVEETAVGGIVGRVASEKLTIEQCINNAKLTNWSIYGMTGGIVGGFVRDNLEILNCIQSGDIYSEVSSNAFEGGILGGTCVYNYRAYAPTLGKVLLRDCYYRVNNNLPASPDYTGVEQAVNYIKDLATVNVNATTSPSDMDFANETYYQDSLYFGNIAKSSASYMYARMNNKFIVEYLVNDEQHHVEFVSVGDHPINVTAPTSPKYNFLGWTDTKGVPITGASLNINKDTRIIASLDWILVPVTFKNFDGTLIAKLDVVKGEMPIYNGATPTRESSVEFDYTFSGWDSDISSADAPKTYTAKYTSSIRKYIVTFDNNGVITTQELEYGSQVKLSEPTPKFGRYLGWENSADNVLYRDSVTITSDTTLKVLWRVGSIEVDDMNTKISGIMVDGASAYTEISALSLMLSSDEYVTYTSSRELLKAKIDEYNAYVANFPNNIDVITTAENNVFGIADALASVAVALSAVGVCLLAKRGIIR